MPLNLKKCQTFETLKNLEHFTRQPLDLRLNLDEKVDIINF